MEPSHALCERALGVVNEPIGSLGFTTTLKIHMGVSVFPKISGTLTWMYPKIVGFPPISTPSDHQFLVGKPHGFVGEYPPF